MICKLLTTKWTIHSTCSYVAKTKALISCAPLFLHAQHYVNVSVLIKFSQKSSIFSSPEPLGSQGELIVYPWSGVRRPSVRPSSTMLKHHLLRNRLADQSQILCGASLGRGNQSLYKWSRSHDQDGRHGHIW